MQIDRQGNHKKWQASSLLHAKLVGFACFPITKCRLLASFLEIGIWNAPFSIPFVPCRLRYAGSCLLRLITVNRLIWHRADKGRDEKTTSALRRLSSLRLVLIHALSHFSFSKAFSKILLAPWNMKYPQEDLCSSRIVSWSWKGITRTFLS